MPLTKIDDHVEEGLALLLGQYKGKPRIAALLTVYLRRVQELEDAIFDVLVKRLIDNATGAQLAAIGRIVGQVNEASWDDNTYRLFIKARIRANKSNGHGDDVIDVINLVEAADFVLSEVYPAAMYVEFGPPTDADPVILIELARRAKGAGVRLQLLAGESEVGIDAFSFCTGTTELSSTTEGFGISDASTGGFLSLAVE
jgi:hypothetical protein